MSNGSELVATMRQLVVFQDFAGLKEPRLLI